MFSYLHDRLAAFLTENLHEKVASLFGFGTAFMAPAASILENIVVATASGFLVWCLTRTTSFLISRLRHKE